MSSVLWLAWKEPDHPQSGGAEVILWELAKRMVHDGHQVTILTCGYVRDGVRAQASEIVDGINVVRVGTNRYLHSFQALGHYLKNLRGKFDVVIETVNTAPYFASLFGGKGAKRYLLYHQLAREIWYHETKAPLSHVGYYLLEPTATWLLGKSGAPTIVVSESTRQDLRRFGHRNDLLHVISEGIHLEPVKDLDKVKKFDKPTLLGLGSFRAMKRTVDQVAAFEAAKAHVPDLRLKLAGDSSGAYGQRVLQRIAASPYKDDIEYLGRVSESAKVELMQRCHLIMVTSLKEGWGLIVTEANSQGTPAVVYDVDGLRDSVRDGETGRVVTPNPTALAKAVVELLNDRKQYDRYRHTAWEWSKQITFDQSYADVMQIIGATA